MTQTKRLIAVAAALMLALALVSACTDNNALPIRRPRFMRSTLCNKRLSVTTMTAGKRPLTTTTRQKALTGLGMCSFLKAILPLPMPTVPTSLALLPQSGLTSTASRMAKSWLQLPRMEFGLTTTSPIQLAVSKPKSTLGHFATTV